MRTSIIIGRHEGGWIVAGIGRATISGNRVEVGDRIANGDAYPDERAIRLPRTLCIGSMFVPGRKFYRRQRRH